MNHPDAQEEAMRELDRLACAVFAAEANLAEAADKVKAAARVMAAERDCQTVAAEALNKARNRYALAARRLIEGAAGVPHQQEASK